MWQRMSSGPVECDKVKFIVVPIKGTSEFAGILAQSSLNIEIESCKHRNM
jgi:hypothetical protein